MTRRYFRIDRFAKFDPQHRARFREILSFGRMWRVEHFFLPREQLPGWLQDDPLLDLSQLGWEFSPTPKSKKIPDFLLEVDLLLVRASLFDTHLRDLVDKVVTAMPLKIGEVDFYFVRPEVVIPCLDEDRSTWLAHDDGRRYKFFDLVLRDVSPDAPDIFRPGEGIEFWGYPVFSEEFVNRCKKAKAIGALFEEVFPLPDPKGRPAEGLHAVY